MIIKRNLIAKVLIMFALPRFVGTKSLGLSNCTQEYYNEHVLVPRNLRYESLVSGVCTQTDINKCDL